ncbi:MAG: hypothetical protein ACFFBZ_01880 [Promethearchaeota archaeon]
MSLDIEESIKKDLEIEKILRKIGLEVVGTKDINDDRLYLIRKKK